MLLAFLRDERASREVPKQQAMDLLLAVHLFLRWKGINASQRPSVGFELSLPGCSGLLFGSLLLPRRWGAVAAGDMRERVHRGDCRESLCGGVWRAVGNDGAIFAEKNDGDMPSCARVRGSVANRQLSSTHAE